MKILQEVNLQCFSKFQGKYTVIHRLWQTDLTLWYCYSDWSTG